MTEVVTSRPDIPKYLQRCEINYEVITDIWARFIKNAIWWYTYKVQKSIQEDREIAEHFLSNCR